MGLFGETHQEQEKIGASPHNLTEALLGHVDPDAADKKPTILVVWEPDEDE